MSGDQETTQENSEETTPENESSEMTIEDTKTELATMYLNFLDKQKGGILSTTAGFGVSLNPLQKDAVEYLTTDVAKDKTDFFSNIGKNIKKKFVEKFTGGTMLEYNKASLNKMKALITQYKDDQIKLQELMAKIAAGTDPTVEPLPATTNTPTTPEATTTPVIPISITYDKLKVGDEASQEDITYIDTNAKDIVEKLEIKGELRKIDNIKDKEGNVILECIGETPYVNSKAAADLIGLSLLYYKKTGQKFLLESVYRTIEHQERLKEINAATGVPTADPGYSGHNLGLSIDVSEDSRYSEKIGGVAGLKKITQMFDFNAISNEDRHFDHSEFVDNYYANKEARLSIAQNLDGLFEKNQDVSQAA